MLEPLVGKTGMCLLGREGSVKAVRRSQNEPFFMFGLLGM